MCASWELQVSVGHIVSQGQSEPSLPAEIARSWLVWQCKMVPGVIHGAIFAINVEGESNK